jgi:signal transduction histidine kinase
MQNLISNAIKYARPGEAPRIAISAREDGESCVFCVRDDGIGIKPQYRDRVFGVFKRLHPRDVEGTGIGLAICKRIVERYRGRIWIESDGERGSSFCFTLPVESGAAPVI